MHPTRYTLLNINILNTLAIISLQLTLFFVLLQLFPSYRNYTTYSLCHSKEISINLSESDKGFKTLVSSINLLGMYADFLPVCLR